MYIFLNGKIIKREEATISIFDHGYMYGLGVFETFRVYQGHPFLFNDHIRRLKQGLKELGIEWDIDRGEVLRQLKELLLANHLTDAYVRLNVSAGIGEIGLQVAPYTNPTVIMYMKPIPASLYDQNEKDGVILQTRRNTPEGIERLKSHHYLNNIIGKREIGTDPSIEGIFLNEGGFLTEGIVSNLFWVDQQRLFTPSVATGILNGITRQFIIEIAKVKKIPIVEGFYPLDKLLEAEEAFVTNSIQEIVPLRKVQDKLLPGKKGKVTASIMSDYQSCTRHLWEKEQFRQRGVQDASE